MNEVKMYVLNAADDVLVCLNGIRYDTVSYTENLLQFDELSFEVDKYIDVDGEPILSAGYGTLKEMMYVYVSGLDNDDNGDPATFLYKRRGRFRISEVEIDNDGFDEKKVVTCDSCECELNNQNLIGIDINTGSVSSAEYIADGNVDSATGLAKEYVLFYNPSNPQLSLLDLLIEEVPYWSVGYVDPQLRNKKFSFEIDNEPIYSFMMNTLASTAQCLFTFDTVNRRINAYSIERVEEIGETNIFVGYRNLLDTTKITKSDIDLYTRFNVEGKDELSIASVNFNDSRLENLLHLLNDIDEDGNLIYANSDIRDKYQAWYDYRYGDSGKRAEYVEVAKKYNQTLIDISDLQNRVPADALDYNQYDGFSVDDLNALLDQYASIVNVMVADFAQKDSDGNIITDDDGLAVIADEAGLKDSIYWEDYKLYTQVLIPNLKIAIANKGVPEDEKEDYIDTFETDWDLYGTVELQGKLDAYQQSLDVLAERGYDRDWEDVPDDEKAKWEEVNYKLYHGQYVKAKNQYDCAYIALNDTDSSGTAMYKDEDGYYLQRSDGSQYYYDSDWNLVEISPKRSGTRLTGRKLELESKQAEQASLVEQRAAIVADAAIENEQFGFTEDELNTIYRLRRDSDYQNDNILITSLDDVVTQLDAMEELFQAAVDELDIESQPQYKIEAKLDNLFNIEAFADYKGEFSTGNFIRMILSDKEYVKLRVTSITRNPCLDDDNELTIQFSNMVRSQNGLNDYTNLFKSAVTSAANKITANYTKNIDASQIMLTDGVLKAIANSTAVYDRVAQLVTETLTAKEGIFDAVNANYISTEEFEARLARVQELQADSAFVKYLEAGFVTISELTTDLANINELIAQKASIADLNAATARIGTLESEYADINTLVAQKADITDLNAATARIDDLEADYADINTLVAKKADITDLNAATARIGTLESDYADISDLVAKKADIADLNATNATVENLKTSKADIADLNAANARIDTLDADKANVSDLKAANAEIDDLKANKANITDLEAVSATVNTLNADTANIKSLLAGNAGVGDLQAIHISSENVVIADATITDAMIADLSAGKITAGTIYTSLVKIASDKDENLLIDGATIQIKDTDGTVRVQIGKDKSGDYNLALWDKSGNLLWDASGVYAAGLHDGIIKDIAVADDANIAAKKLNIPSIVTAINENGDLVVSSGQIIMDESGQTLSADFKTITTNVTNAQSTADSAATAAGNAQSAADAAEKHTQTVETALGVVQGQISGKIWQTDIDSAVDELDGKIDTVSDQYTTLDATVSGIQTTVGSMQTTLDTKADGSTVSALETRVASAEQDLSGFKTTVSSTYQTITDAAKDLNTAKGYADDVGSTVETNANNYTDNQLKSYVTTSKYSELEQSVDGFKTTVSSTYETKTDAAAKLTSAKSYTDTEIDGIEIGGRNYILNSTGNYGTNNWNGNAGALIITITDGINNQKAITLTPTNISGNRTIAPQDITDRLVIAEDTTLTISYWYKAGVNAVKRGVGAMLRLANDAYPYNDVFSPGDTQIVDGEWHYYSKTADVGKYANTGISSISFMLFCQGDSVSYSNIKLETGNKATDWTPAPEDVEADVTSVRTYAEQLSDKFYWLVESDSSSSSITLTDSMLNAVTNQLVISDPAGSSTIIEGGKIKASAITSTMLATDAIKSRNYQASSDTSSPYSATGTYLDLTNGNFYTPNFGLDNVNGQAYFNGVVNASSGQIGSDDTNYWQIATLNDYNMQQSAAIVGHGTSYIQSGKWMISADRINTQQYDSNRKITYINQDNTYWDFGVQAPELDTSATGYIAGVSDNFLYIRNHASTIPTIETDWNYVFRVDKNGMIYINGKSLDEKYASIDGVSGQYLPLTGGTVSGDLTVNGTLTATASQAAKTIGTLSVNGKSFDGSTGVSVGTMGVGYGGTGKSSWTAYGIVYANSKTSLSQLDVGTSGQVLQSKGSAAPQWVDLSNLTVGTATKATQDGNGKVIADTYMPVTGGTFTGAVNVDDELYATSATVGSLIVQGVGRFTNGLYGDLIGTASSASKLNNDFVLKLNGGATEGTNLFTYNGSAAKTVNITKSSIGLGNVDNTADTNKSVKYATSAGSAETLTGLTATVSELNYVDGVTSNIQTQLNAKAASSHNHDDTYLKLSGGTLTGNLTINNTDPVLTVNNSSNTGDSAVILGRDAASCWRIINNNANLRIQNNWTTAQGDYFDVLKMNYNTGNALFKGTVAASSFLGNATSATTATTANNVSTEAGNVNAARHVWFSDSSTETKRNHDDDFKYNPSTNVLTVGSITGSAATLTTPRTLTIGATGKTFNGSGDVSWTKAEISGNASTSEAGWMSVDDKSKLDSITVTSGGEIATKNITVSRGLSNTSTVDGIYNIGHENSITAGTASGTATSTLSNGGSFNIPTVSYNGYGHVTGKGTTTITLPTITKSTVGLGNVDNTADANKIVKEAGTLTGLTATVSELNYVDGVTSNIQTQLNNKAASSHTHDDRYYTEAEINNKLSAIPESSLTWGNKAISGGFYGGDIFINDFLRANRFAGLKAAGITVEYSTDGGDTWTNYAMSDTQKRNLFTISCPVYVAGSSTGTVTANNQLRIIVDSYDGGIYTTLKKLHLYISTNYSTNCTVTITAAHPNSPDDYTLTICEDQPISGWSGWNVIPCDFTTYGNSNSQYRKIKFVFKQEGLSDTSKTGGLIVQGIFAFGGVGWNTPSRMALYGHAYEFDGDMNVVFPANVHAASFTGNLTGTASKATTADTATKATQDSDGNAINTTYLKLSGGTMTGMLNAKANINTDAYTGAINMKNSNIYGINSLITSDLADNAAEGIQWYRTATTVDSFWVRNGVMYFTPDRTLGDASATTYTVLTSGNYSSWVASASHDHDSAYLKLTGGTLTGNLVIKGTTSASNAYGSTNPTLSFHNSGSAQNASLVFTDYDSVKSPASLTLIGNQGGEYFIAPNVEATGSVYADTSVVVGSHARMTYDDSLKALCFSFV